MIELRRIGNSGLETPPLILGGNVFGWTADATTSFAVLDAFVAGGGRMIDTADVYSRWAPERKGGESEAIIGDWLARRRRPDSVLIATKVGADGGLSAGNIETRVHGSLKRLRVESIDLLYAHRDDPNTPLDETLEAFERLLRAGKIRTLGASNYSAARLEEAARIAEERRLTGFSVLQTHYNLLERAELEGDLLPAARRRDIDVCAYYALANGYLTGKYRSTADLSKSHRGERVRKYMAGNGPRVLAALDRIAQETGHTPAQVALAWVAAKITAPIASATSVAQVQELLGALELALSAEQVEALNAASG
ncbi:MAG TPA: aldo/keto reductase [Xanthobacteraceae bacterium]|jgi:aryl-alcohol dehydrogenase-like predicted oxidoreductase